MSFDLLEARLNAGLSQRDLAKSCGVPVTTIQRLEAGEGGAHPRNAKKVADHFDIKVTDLLPVERNAA